MSLAGLRKQLNKANQYISETVGAAEATSLDPEYAALEKKYDRTAELIEDLVVKCREYLQPNPVTRAKMATTGLISKTAGTTGKTARMPYPQPEGLMGEAMVAHGRALGDESVFARALIDAGESYRQCADVKYALEDAVKQNFIDPLIQLQNKDLREVAHHRKKLQGRRLDYDCKKRSASSREDMFLAEEKLEESKKLAEQAMFNVLDNDMEQISQLSALVAAQLDFHRQTTSVLESLQEVLKDRLEDASSRSRKEHIPKPVLSARSTPRTKSPVPEGATGGADPWATGAAATNGGAAPAAQDPWGQPPPAYAPAGGAPKPAGGPAAPTGPHCKALYDFEAENEGELSFKEGQLIALTSQIDENWFEGRAPNGQTGFFPVTYVQVVKPLP